MNPAATWALIAAALAAGWYAYGWQGLVLAVTAITFWMLLQFSRVTRVMRKAGNAPVGRVNSAVMLQSKLREGMSLMQVLALTGSLGERIEPPAEGAEESWRWCDDGGVCVTISLRGGRVVRWMLERPQNGV